MIKSLKNVFEEINSTYSNIHYTLNKSGTDDEQITFHTTIVSEHFKGEASVTGVIQNSGIINLYFTFGEIEPTEEAKDLINTFNLAAALAKGYIGEIAGKKHFEIRYANCFELDDAETPVLYKFFFDDALSEGLEPFLKPIVELTK